MWRACAATGYNCGFSDVAMTVTAEGGFGNLDVNFAITVAATDVWPNTFTVRALLCLCLCLSKAAHSCMLCSVACCSGRPVVARRLSHWTWQPV